MWILSLVAVAADGVSEFLRAAEQLQLTTRKTSELFKLKLFSHLSWQPLPSRIAVFVRSLLSISVPLVLTATLNYPYKEIRNDLSFVTGKAVRSAISADWCSGCRLHYYLFNVIIYQSFWHFRIPKPWCWQRLINAHFNEFFSLKMGATSSKMATVTNFLWANRSFAGLQFYHSHNYTMKWTWFYYYTYTDLQKQCT